MTIIDDRPIAKPPYEEGPNREKLPTKPVNVAKLIEVLRQRLMGKAAEAL